MSDRIVLIIAGNEFTVNLIRYIKRTCSEVPQSRLSTAARRRYKTIARLRMHTFHLYAPKPKLKCKNTVLFETKGTKMLSNP